LSWSVALDQPVTHAARRTLQRALAEREIAAAEAALEQVKRGIAARVRLLALSHTFAARREKAARDVATRAGEILAELRLREPAGMVALLETRTLEGHVIALQQDAASDAAEAATARAVLNALAGRDTFAPLELGAETDAALPDLPPDAALVDAARSWSADLLLAQRDVERRRAEVDLSRRETSTGYTISPFAEGEQVGEASEVTVGVGVSIPWAIRNTNAAGIAAAQARVRQAEALLAAAEREVAVRVAELRAAYDAARSALDADSEKRMDELKAAVELGDRHYRIGAVPIGTYLDLHEQYFDALQATLATRESAERARLELETLTGLDLSAVKGSSP
jgi:cobalt-zinc-cadmium efflux system outer membrane protein